VYAIGGEHLDWWDTPPKNGYVTYEPGVKPLTFKFAVN